MLYKDDNRQNYKFLNEYQYNEEHVRKLNVKKVVIFLTSCFICLLVLFSSFFITFHSMNKGNNAEEAIISQSNEQELPETNTIDETKNIVVEEKIVQNKIEEEKTIPVKDEETEIPKKEEVVKPVGNEFPKANPNGHEEVKQIYFSDEKQVYLTFDDGPSKEITPKILDVLKEEKVTATFFVLGSRVELSPELVRRELNEGHFIANHGYSHIYSRIYSSVDSVVDEYNKCEQAVRDAIGNQNYYSRLFRFPGGSSGGPYNNLKAQAKEYLISQGIASTNWNSLTGDAEGIKSKDKLINRMISTIGTNKSIILLMHDAEDKSYTLEALPEVIHYFKERDYSFKNFYEIFPK